MKRLFPNYMHVFILIALLATVVQRVNIYIDRGKVMSKIRWFITILLIWHALGAGLSWPLIDYYGYDYLNPIWVYRHSQLNCFGAAMICILSNLLCPIISICYWAYKLCTVGRK